MEPLCPDRRRLLGALPALAALSGEAGGAAVVEHYRREGRALLWDKDLDRQQQAEYQTARVAQKPYVYQTNHD